MTSALIASGQRFSFFQAVRLIEILAVSGFPAGARPGLVGIDSDPSLEAVRFRARQSIGFPPHDVDYIRGLPGMTRRDGQEVPVPARLEMQVSFLGLTGPNSALPRHYTRLAIENQRTALPDFFDIFNHRLISLFYRAWQKYRLAVSYERTKLTGGKGQADAVAAAIYSLVGIGTPRLREIAGDQHDALLFFSGLLANRRRPAAALGSMLSEYFGVPCSILQFVGQWLKVESGCRATLSSQADPRSNLRQGMVLGSQTWDVQSRFRVCLGPVGYAKFRAFLPEPTGKALRQLCALTRDFVGAEFDFDVQIELPPEEVPACTLSSAPDQAAMLGWTTWLQGSGMPPTHARIVVQEMPRSQSYEPLSPSAGEL